MQKFAIVVALGAAFGLFGNRASAQCATGTCARPAITSYRYAPTTTYARGYRAAAPSYVAQPATAPAQAPAYTYQPRVAAQPAPAAYAAPQPTYQVAQTRPYTYQRNYAPMAASCPTGTCPYVR